MLESTSLFYNFDFLTAMAAALFLLAVLLFASNMVYAIPPLMISILLVLWAFWIKQNKEIEAKYTPKENIHKYKKLKGLTERL